MEKGRLSAESVELRRVSQDIITIDHGLRGSGDTITINMEIEESRRLSQERSHKVSEDFRPFDADTAFLYAAYCLEDALNGRDAHGKLTMYRDKDRLHQLAFLTDSSPFMFYLFHLAVFCHSLIAFFEADYRTVSISVTCPCLFVYFLSLFTRLLYMGPLDALGKHWNLLQTVLTLAFLLDFFLYIGGVLQPFRLLRPWILLCRNRELRRVYQALIDMIPVLVRVLFTIVVFLFFAASVGVHTFMNDYHSDRVYFNGTDEADYTGSFDNSLVAFTNLFVLITTENYPNFMLPAYRLHERSFAFFGLCLVIGVFYILPMLLAVVMQAFWKSTGQQVKKDRKKERKKLIQAFNYLDPDGDGFIELEMWLGLMNVYRPEMTPEQHEFLFNLLDKDNDGQIDVIGFLEVGTIMKYTLTDECDDDAEAVQHYEHPAMLHIQSMCRKIVDWAWWDSLILWFIVLHWLLFCVEYRGMDSLVQTVIHALQLFLFIVFVLDVAMRVVVRGPKFEYNTNFFGVPISFIEIAALLVTFVDVILYWTRISRTGFLSSIGDIAQFLRILYKSNASLHAMHILDLILPLSVRLLMLLLFFSFSYSVLGLLIYDHVPFDESPQYCKSDTPGGPDYNFSTLWCSWLVVFQVITTSNWHLLMIEVISKRTRWDFLFFFTFFVLTNFIILSLMVGVFIDAFFKVSKRKAETLLGQTGTEAPRSSSPRPPDLPPEDHHARRSSEHIQFMADADPLGEMLEASANVSHIVETFQRRDSNEPATPTSPSVPSLRRSEPSFSRKISDSSFSRKTSERKKIRRVDDELKTRMDLNTRRRENRGMSSSVSTSALPSLQPPIKLTVSHADDAPRVVVAVKNYDSEKMGTLELRKGDIISVVEQSADGKSFRGSRNGSVGWFDASCVLLVDTSHAHPLLPPAPSPPKGRENEDLSFRSNSSQVSVDKKRHKSFVLHQHRMSPRSLLEGEITKMNPDELRELNAIAKADLLSRRKSRLKKNKVEPITSPYICKYCGDSFHGEPVLRQHLKAVHERDTRDSDPEIIHHDVEVINEEDEEDQYGRFQTKSGDSFIRVSHTFHTITDTNIKSSVEGSPSNTPATTSKKLLLPTSSPTMGRRSPTNGSKNSSAPILRHPIPKPASRPRSPPPKGPTKHVHIVAEDPSTASPRISPPRSPRTSSPRASPTHFHLSAEVVTTTQVKAPSPTPGEKRKAKRERLRSKGNGELPDWCVKFAEKHRVRLSFSADKLDIMSPEDPQQSVPAILALLDETERELNEQQSDLSNTDLDESDSSPQGTTTIPPIITEKLEHDVDGNIDMSMENPSVDKVYMRPRSMTHLRNTGPVIEEIKDAIEELKEELRQELEVEESKKEHHDTSMETRNLVEETAAKYKSENKDAEPDSTV